MVSLQTLTSPPRTRKATKPLFLSSGGVLSVEMVASSCSGSALGLVFSFGHLSSLFPVYPRLLSITIMTRLLNLPLGSQAFHKARRFLLSLAPARVRVLPKSFMLLAMKPQPRDLEVL